MAVTSDNTKVVRTMCPMNFCGMLIEVEGGKLKTVSGDKENADSQGFLCMRGRSTNEIFGKPRRLLYPQIREAAPSSGYPSRTQTRDSCPMVIRSRSTTSEESTGKGTRHRRRAARCGLDPRWMGRAQSSHIQRCCSDRRRSRFASVLGRTVSLCAKVELARI